MQDEKGRSPSQDRPQQPILDKRPGPVQDLPGCIKYILLLFLILLLLGELASGEFNKVVERDTLSWIILLIKLGLIGGLIALIRVQRDLNCNITDPAGCASTEYDAALDKTIIRVKGTASGAVFGHYTLAVQLSGNPFPMPAIYPGGGASGTAPVINGELGKLDVSGVDPTPGFTVILTVYPAGAGSPKTCPSNFDIQLKSVYIERIGEVTAQVIGPYPADPSQVLKLVKVNPDPPSPALPGPEASLADSISVFGGADVYGCSRQMVEYALQYRQVDSGHDPWLPNDPSGSWSLINAALPYGDPNHPRAVWSFWGTIANYIRNGKLTRVWQLTPILQSIFPIHYANRWITTESAWNTTGLNGRYTARVYVKHQPIMGPPDPVPPVIYDAATCWLDNRQINGKITGMAITGGSAIGGCDEQNLSMFVNNGHKLTADIIGRAWDPIILNSYPHTDKPNDNFDSFQLEFEKDGSGSWFPIATSSTRVPNTLQETPLPPLPAGTGPLTAWDIVGALDAGPMPGGSPPDPSPKIYRGQRCAYLIHLHVQDTTHRGDSSTPHYVDDWWPFCIVNDLPKDLPFPVPA